MGKSGISGSTVKCAGSVGTFHSRCVLITGALTSGGERITKAAARRMVEQAGGYVTTDESRKVHIVIWANLSYQILADPRRQRSSKLLFVERERDAGSHICSILGEDFLAVLGGHPRQCVTSRL